MSATDIRRTIYSVLMVSGPLLSLLIKLLMVRLRDYLATIIYLQSAQTFYIASSTIMCIIIIIIKLFVQICQRMKHSIDLLERVKAGKILKWSSE